MTTNNTFLVDLFDSIFTLNLVEINNILRKKDKNVTQNVDGNLTKAQQKETKNQHKPKRVWSLPSFP